MRRTTFVFKIQQMFGQSRIVTFGLFVLQCGLKYYTNKKHSINYRMC